MYVETEIQGLCLSTLPKYPKLFAWSTVQGPLWYCMCTINSYWPILTYIDLYWPILDGGSLDTFHIHDKYRANCSVTGDILEIYWNTLKNCFCDIDLRSKIVANGLQLQKYINVHAKYEEGVRCVARVV